MENTFRYTRFYGTDLPPLLAKFATQINLKEKLILDLGAGDGEILYSLWKKGYAEENKSYATEISPFRCDKLRTLSNKIFVDEGDATHTPYEPNKFDFIICNQVIEHVEEPAKLLSEAYRVLKPNRCMYLSTVFKKKFNFGYYWNAKGERVLDPTHLREYTHELELLTDMPREFKILYQQKTLQWFAITDFLFKRLGFNDYIYEKSVICRWLRKIRLPIIGYYCWELLLYKKG